jgi:hypothetical protein
MVAGTVEESLSFHFDYCDYGGLLVRIFAQL